MFSRLQKAGMHTVEEAASSMSRYFLQAVNEEDSELKVMAEHAYISFIRAYASFSGEMRSHFTFRRLHLGHVARAFCLSELPSQIGRSSKPAKVGKRRKNSEGYEAENPRTVKKYALDCMLFQILRYVLFYSNLFSVDLDSWNLVRSFLRLVMSHPGRDRGPLPANWRNLTCWPSMDSK